MAEQKYIGVYKNSRGNLYHFDSYVSDKLGVKKRTTVSGFKTAKEAHKAKLEFEKKNKRKLLAQETGKFTAKIKELVEDYTKYLYETSNPSTATKRKQVINLYVLKDNENKTPHYFATKIFNNLTKSILNSSLNNKYQSDIIKFIKDMYRYGYQNSLVSFNDVVLLDEITGI